MDIAGIISSLNVKAKSLSKQSIITLFHTSKLDPGNYWCQMSNAVKTGHVHQTVIPAVTCL